LLVGTIITKYRRAVENQAEAQQGFESLTNAAPPESIDIWKATIEEAEALRFESPNAMDVMHSKIRKGQSLKDIMAAVMQEDLTAKNFGPVSTSTDWMAEGLNIEDEQWVYYLTCKFHCFIEKIEFVSDNWSGKQGGIRVRKNCRTS
jgi:hypothetical protein